jgi:hypothetical protein
MLPARLDACGTARVSRSGPAMDRRERPLAARLWPVVQWRYGLLGRLAQARLEHGGIQRVRSTSASVAACRRDSATAS